MARPFPVLAAALLLLLAEDASGAGLLVPRDGSPPIAVRSHRVTAEMTDGLARTTLRQTFVNPHSRALEAVYVFPIPEGAALVDVAMEVGGQRLEGLLVERKRARRIYDDIVRRRKDPALVEQIGREKFRLSVFPVLPESPTVVELTWIQRIPLSQDVFRYVYPLALGGGAAKTEQDFTFLLRVRSTLPIAEVAASREDLDVVRRGPHETTVSFESMRAKLERDVVVTARVVTAKPTLTVRTFRGTEGRGWFLAAVTPPKAREGRLIPRDVILVVDTSGSMRGRKIEQAREAAFYLIDHLRVADRVNVLRFSSSTDGFGEAPVPATPENRAKLREFVAGFGAGGGTALGDALRTALDVPPTEGRVRTVVFLTDGLPTVGEQDPAKIVGFAKAGAERGLEVFCFGVGTDVNPTLLRGISEASGGRAEIFEPAGEIEGRLTAFLSRTASPVISDIRLDFGGIATSDVLPRHVPDAYLGEQVLVVGRYRGGGRAKVTASAVVGGRPAKLEAAADFREEPGGPRTVAWLFAKEKLAYLERALRLRQGLSDDAYYAALDRGAYSTGDEITGEMVATSIDHGVQSAYASFLVLLPEDRHRIDPRNAEAVAKAMERARLARAALAPDGEAPPDDGGTPAAAESERGGRPSSAASRGGTSYRGPAGEVPPGQRDPKDAQPPPENPGTPTTPPGGPPPAGPAGGIATPGGGRRPAPKAMTFENWLFWWAHNRDAIVLEWTAPRPALAEDARARIIAALEETGATAGAHPAIREAALIALARADGTGERARYLVKHAAPKSGTAEGAVLALAMLPAAPPEVRELLIAAADDASRPKGVRVRAVLVLGLLRDASDEAFGCLERRVRGNALDLSVSAFLAMGLAGDASRVPGMVGGLESGKVGGRKLRDLERAHLAGALGRIGDARAIDTVLRVLRGKGLHARRAAAIALGGLVPAAPPDRQPALVGKLARALGAERDPTARNFFVVSLGRICGDARTDVRAKTRCLKLLTGEFQDGHETRERPYAALALGLAREGDAAVSERIRRALAELRGDEVALGALAISLGLLGDDGAETTKLLARIAADRGLEKKLRGSAVVALGLAGVESAKPVVRGVLMEREDRDLRIDAAIAARLLGDEEAEAPLIAVLTHPKSSQFVLAGAARALGAVGSAKSIDALIRILEPGTEHGAYPDVTRVHAAAALGRLASGGDDPLARLAEDFPHRATTPELGEVLRTP